MINETERIECQFEMLFSTQIFNREAWEFASHLVTSQYQTLLETHYDRIRPRLRAFPDFAAFTELWARLTETQQQAFTEKAFFWVHNCIGEFMFIPHSSSNIVQMFPYRHPIRYCLVPKCNALNWAEESLMQFWFLANQPHEILKGNADEDTTMEVVRYTYEETHWAKERRRIAKLLVSII
jgi:hypothetical protein